MKSVRLKSINQGKQTNTSKGHYKSLKGSLDPKVLSRSKPYFRDESTKAFIKKQSLIQAFSNSAQK